MTFCCLYYRIVPSILTFVCQRRRTRLLPSLCRGGSGYLFGMYLHTFPLSCRVGSFNGFTIDRTSNSFHICLYFSFRVKLYIPFPYPVTLLARSVLCHGLSVVLFQFLYMSFPVNSVFPLPVNFTLNSYLGNLQTVFVNTTFR